MARLLRSGAISLLAAIQVQLADGLFDRHHPLEIELDSRDGRVRARVDLTGPVRP